MTTFTVTDCSTDSQLQDAISHAADGDTITFACSGTITLTSTLTIKRKARPRAISLWMGAGSLSSLMVVTPESAVGRWDALDPQRTYAR